VLSALKELYFNRCCQHGTIANGVRPPRLHTHDLKSCTQCINCTTLGKKVQNTCFISRYFRTRIHRIKKADPTGWTATALKGVTTSSPRTFWCHFLQAHLLQFRRQDCKRPRPKWVGKPPQGNPKYMRSCLYTKTVRDCKLRY